MSKKKFFKNGNKIKICVFSFYGFSLFNKYSSTPFGGSEVQMFILSKELAKNKHLKINFIIGDYNLKKKVVIYQNMKIYVCIPMKKCIKNYIKGFINLLSSLITINPDIIVQRTAGIETGFLALFCKIFKKKFIFSIAHKMDVIKNGIKGFKKKIYKYGLNHASYIVAQNEEQINYLKGLKIKRMGNIGVIKNGFKIVNIDSKNKKNILWVGRSIKWKRPELFLKLAENFPYEEFVMIMSKFYEKNALYYWDKISNKAKNISNIKFFDFIPFDEIDTFFKNSKIFINTSIYEGFPNTFIQALKNKTPIISLNVDPDHFLSYNKCGFNCKDDFAKMEFYLKLLLEDQELYKKYSNNSFIYVKKNHDINIIARKWYDLINNLIFNKTVSNHN